MVVLFEGIFSDDISGSTKNKVFFYKQTMKTTQFLNKFSHFKLVNILKTEALNYK